MSKRSKHVNGSHGFKTGGTQPFPVGGSHTFHTGGPGAYLKEAKSGQQPAEPLPPTMAQPYRMHKRMGCP